MRARLRPRWRRPTPTGDSGSTGLGRDVLAILDSRARRSRSEHVQVLTRPMDRVEEPRIRTCRAWTNPSIYGADCTIAVEPTRPIEGVVRDADTKAPIPGAVVTAAALRLGPEHRGPDLHQRPTPRATTGSSACPRRARAQAERLSAARSALLRDRGLKVPAGPGFEPVRFDIALKRGIWITGKVDRRGDRQARAGRGRLLPVPGERHAKDYPNFDPEHHGPSLDRHPVQDRPRADFASSACRAEGSWRHTDDRSTSSASGASGSRGDRGSNRVRDQAR